MWFIVIVVVVVVCVISVTRVFGNLDVFWHIVNKFQTFLQDSNYIETTPTWRYSSEEVDIIAQALIF